MRVLTPTERWDTDSEDKREKHPTARYSHQRTIEAKRLTAIAARYNERVCVVSARPCCSHRRYWASGASKP